MLYTYTCGWWVTTVDQETRLAISTAINSMHVWLSVLAPFTCLGISDKCVLNLLTLCAEAAWPPQTMYAMLLCFGGELDLPEASAAHQQEPFGKHVHPAIRIHPTISLLSEAWGYITEGEASRYWSSSSHVLWRRSNVNQEGLGTRVGKLWKWSSCNQVQCKRLSALTVLPGRRPKYACAVAG